MCRLTSSFRSLAFLVALAFGAPLALPGSAPAIQAQPDTTRWMPELTMQYDEITATQISPDGDHVAYVVREAVMDETTSTFRQHIHVAATDGSSDAQYTWGEQSNWSPKWSPDGRRLAFLSDRSERPQVYVMRASGGEAYAVTDAETGVNDFEWGPHGERIAYTMTDPKSGAEEQREKEKRDVLRVNEEFRYSHLYTTAVKPAQQAAETVQRLTSGSLHVWAFDWSPDGSTIVFAHRPTPRINSLKDTDLSTVPADSGTVSSLVDRPGRDWNPHYGPDGRTIAFVSEGGEARAVRPHDAYVVPAEGGTPTTLPSTSNRDVALIGWASGGEALLVSDADGTSRHVYALPLDGDTSRQVTSGQGVYQAVSYSRSADRLAVTYETSSEPADVYVGPRLDFTRRKLSAVHADVPRPEMGRTERVSWTGGNGEEVEGLLTYPVGYDGGRVPMVLDVHGGPAGVDLRSFTGGRGHFPPQVFAQHGYAVLRPNPRGSTGYGPVFREAVIENWGPGPLEDLMAGVDHAVDRGVAHPDSLVIRGGSYGGYMTAWAVTQTDRFRAASMAAGVSNFFSLVGTTDIPWWGAGMFGGEFWDEPQVYEEQSPLYHVENVTTPTQVLHGTEDERVPPSQGREFYRALKRRGVPTEFVLYPRTPHGAREPKLMMDFASRTIDWFDEHLGRTSTGS